MSKPFPGKEAALLWSTVLETAPDRLIWASNNRRTTAAAPLSICLFSMVHGVSAQQQPAALSIWQQHTTAMVLFYP
jgi:hypothetical protein